MMRHLWESFGSRIYIPNPDQNEDYCQGVVLNYGEAAQIIQAHMNLEETEISLQDFIPGEYSLNLYCSDVEESECEFGNAELWKHVKEKVFGVAKFRVVSTTHGLTAKVIKSHIFAFPYLVI